MRQHWIILSASLALSACSNSDVPNTGGVSPGTGTVKILVLGDAGAPAPDGESGNVAVVAQKVCALRGCDFAVMAGDNIYEMGAVDANDPLFDLAFATPFADLEMPFFVALGNHDNSTTAVGEGSSNFKGDAQVAYHYSSANSGMKWRMPDRYYTQTWPEGVANPVVEFFVLDSSPLSHFYDDPNPQWSGDSLSSYIAAQKIFLQDRFDASTARWKFALAHHPYISNGDHGNAGQFDVGAAQDPCTIAGPLASGTCRGEQYKEFVEQTLCGKADVFFTGHDHNLIWMAPAPSCGKTEHILSGATSKERDLLDESRNAAYYQKGATFGFFWVELSGNTFHGAAYEVLAGGEPASADADGNPLPAFERSFTRQP